MQRTSVADALFTKTQQKVLRLLFGRPDARHSFNEIVRASRAGTGAVARELEKLVSAGVVRDERLGNQRFYRANDASPVYEPLRAISTRVLGVAQVLKEALAPFETDIAEAFVFGSVAKGTDTADSDIDVLVIGGVDLMTLLETTAVAQNLLGRQIHVNLYSKEEWEQVQHTDSVVSTILDGPLIRILPHE